MMSSSRSAETEADRTRPEDVSIRQICTEPHGLKQNRQVRIVFVNRVIFRDMGEHRRRIDGKSLKRPAYILCKEEVTIFDFPFFPVQSKLTHRHIAQNPSGIKDAEAKANARIV